MTQSSFRSPKPLCFRLWHWLNALVLFGILGTVFLRKTFLSWKSNAAIVETKLHAAGIDAPQAVITDITKTIRNNMWDWHITLGFAFAFLFLVRIIIAIKHRKNKQAATTSHHKLVRLSYIVFYLATFFSVVSGLVMNWSDRLGLSQETFKLIEDNHEKMLFLYIAFVVLHIVGVVVAEMRGDRGLISDMVNGGNQKGSSS